MVGKGRVMHVITTYRCIYLHIFTEQHFCSVTFTKSTKETVEQNWRFECQIHQSTTRGQLQANYGGTIPVFKKISDEKNRIMI